MASFHLDRLDFHSLDPERKCQFHGPCRRNATLRCLWDSIGGVLVFGAPLVSRPYRLSELLQALGGSGQKRRLGNWNRQRALWKTGLVQCSGLGQLHGAGRTVRCHGGYADFVDRASEAGILVAVGSRPYFVLFRLSEPRCPLRNGCFCCCFRHWVVASSLEFVECAQRLCLGQLL